MKTLNVSVPAKKIKGDSKGEKLFAVVWVDTEDTEDTTTEFWQANNTDHLIDLLGEELAGGDLDYEPGITGPDINEEFGYRILATEIGKIS